MQVAAQRCDYNLTQCEDFSKITIPDICRILNQKDMFWSQFIAHSKIVCPIKRVISKNMLKSHET